MKNNMESLTVVELKKLAKEVGVPRYSTMRKGDLISHLSRVRRDQPEHYLYVIFYFYRNRTNNQI